MSTRDAWTEDRVAAAAPGEQVAIETLKRKLVKLFGYRKHDADALVHIPWLTEGKQWVAVECKAGAVKPDEQGREFFWYESESFHDGLHKLIQNPVLVLFHGDGRLLVNWLWELRIIGCKPRTTPGPGTTGDTAYKIALLGDDGHGAFQPLDEFIKAGYLNRRPQCN